MAADADAGADAEAVVAAAAPPPADPVGHVRSGLIQAVMGQAATATPVQMAQFQAAMLQACGRVFRTSKQYISLTGLAGMRIRTASAVLLNARERFRISLSVRTPHAAQLFCVLLTDTVDPANARAQKGIPANQRSWAAWHYDALRRSGFDPKWRVDVELTYATTMPWEPTLHANETVTQMAALTWAKQARQELGKYARDRARNRATAKLGAPKITAALSAVSLMRRSPTRQCATPDTTCLRGSRPPCMALPAAAISLVTRCRTRGPSSSSTALGSANWAPLCSPAGTSACMRRVMRPRSRRCV